MEYYLAIKRTKQLSFATTKGFAGGTRNKEPASNAEDVRDAGSILGQEDPLEEGMATHPSILV